MDPGFCGHYSSADGGGNMNKLFGSSCQACADSKVVFWVKGKCSPEDSDSSS